MKNKINIRSIVRLTLCSLLFLGAANIPYGCSDGLDLPTPPASDQLAEAGYITLSLTCGNHGTRAEEEPGIERYNENRIKSVTLCLSPSAGDRTDADAPAFMQTFTNIDAEGKAILRIPLTMELVTRLFNENNSMSCRIFAAVNVDPGEAKTVEQLRNLVIGSEFATTMIQDSFAMDGDGTVEYTPSGNYAVGNVQLKRSAAKITLGLKVDTEVSEVVNGETIKWNPNLEGMRVRLEQGVCTSTLDPSPSFDMDSEVYFNSDDDLMYTFEETDANGEYNRIQSIPLYTYPNKWTDRIDEKHGTFLLLSVPWTSDGGTTYRTCYYHVPIIPFDKFELVRNISYHVNLHVGVLGSFVPEEPFEVEGEYYVVEWGTEDIEVDIKDYRYLVVDQNDYVVNNENSISVPFYTSHKTEVVDISMTFFRYNFSDEGTEFPVKVTMEMNERSKTDGGKYVFTYDFNNDTNILTVNHDLTIWNPYDSDGKLIDLTNGGDKVDNAGKPTRPKTQTEEEIEAYLKAVRYFKEMSASDNLSNDEYSAVVFNVTVQHSDVADGTSGIDRNLYKETVTITQYPGMYITAVQNNTDLIGERWSSGALGNTIINGRYDDYTTTAPATSTPLARQLIANWTNWDYSLGLSTSFLNWNPNLYLVTITQLAPDTEMSPGVPYKIGDPRSYYINNNLESSDVDGYHPDAWQTEYWVRSGNGDNWNVSRVYNPTQEQINTILNGREITPGNPRGGKWTWNQGFILNGFTKAKSIYGTSPRTLTYYYPTREDNDNQNTLAPKFRICSSYGGSSTYMTREMGRRRAAAYQELGYCAGRWRLPTFGEVKFIMELSRQNKIPRLFGQDTGVWYYWCAQGAVLVPKRGDTQTEIKIVANPGQNGNPDGGSGAAVTPFTGNQYKDHVRFVYDEWYWGSGTIEPKPGETANEDTPIYDFTWGDRPKSNPQD